MIAASAYLALAAAFVVAVAAASLPGILHSLAPYAVAALWAYALWLAHRAAKRRYHRRGHRHARPTLTRRLRLFARHVRSIRLRATDTPDTGLATITHPDIRQFARHA